MNLKQIVMEDVKSVHQDLLLVLQILVLLVKVKIVELVILIDQHAQLALEDSIWLLPNYVYPVQMDVHPVGAQHQLVLHVLMDISNKKVFPN